MTNLIEVGGLTFAITPHRDAPLFGDLGQARLYLAQLIGELQSENPQVSGKEVTELLRQAGLVSLWFFLKCICGPFGPYDLIDTGLNLDMCNFRQSDDCMGVGARGAGFLFRGSLKSTIFSHGADTWELLRDPDLKICIVNAIVDKAYEFMHNVKNNFEKNELVARLYPEYVPGPNQERWNNSEIVMPNRSKFNNNPSVRALGAGGAAEGGHFDLLNADDLVGLDDLGADYSVNMDMFHKIKWWRTNSRALLMSVSDSRIVAVGTRYSSDDVWELLVNDMRKLVGYQDPDMVSKVREDGQYSIYYRHVKENGEATLPRVMTAEQFDKLMEEDPWTALTQYANNPKNSGLAELNTFEVKKCMLVWQEDKGWMILRMPKEGPHDMIRLSECDVVMSIDPAGTDTGMSAKTSRSSIGIQAMDWDENVYRVWGRVGYFNIHEIFDFIFEGNEQFEGYIRETVVESNAMQKIIAPLLQKEQWERGIWIGPRGVPAKGDKAARIRSTVGLYASQGKLWTTDEAGAELREEMEVFPTSKYKMDVLDEVDKGITALSRPFTPDEVWEAEEQDLRYEMATTNNVVGY